MSLLKGNQGCGQGDPMFDVQEARHGAMGRNSEKTDAFENEPPLLELNPPLPRVVNLISATGRELLLSDFDMQAIYIIPLLSNRHIS